MCVCCRAGCRFNSLSETQRPWFLISWDPVGKQHGGSLGRSMTESVSEGRWLCHHVSSSPSFYLLDRSVWHSIERKWMAGDQAPWPWDFLWLSFPCLQVMQAICVTDIILYILYIYIYASKNVISVCCVHIKTNLIWGTNQLSCYFLVIF